MQFRKPSPRIVNLWDRLESTLKTWGALGVAVFAAIYYASTIEADSTSAAKAARSPLLPCDCWTAKGRSWTLFSATM